MHVSNRILCLVLLSVPLSAYCKGKKEKQYDRTKNTISLCYVYNTGNYKFAAKAVNTEFVERHNNAGISYRRDMYILPNDFYLSLGLRAISTKSEVVIRTDVPGVDKYSSEFTFAPKVTQVTVPILLGKSIALKNYQKANLDLFAGGSLGAAKITSYGTAYRIANAQGNTDQIGVNYSNFSADVSRIVFNATLEAGFQFTPFGTPRLTLGCIASYNLLQSPSYKDSGGFGNLTQKKYDNFNIDFSRQFINVLFTVGYSFGGKMGK